MWSFGRAVQSRRAVAFTHQLCIRNSFAAYPAIRLLQPRPSLRLGFRRNKWFYISFSPELPRLRPLSPSITNVDNGNKDEDDICRDHFMGAFPSIVKDLIDTGNYTDKPDVTGWIAELLQYNVPGSNMNRGLALVHSYKMFCPKSELNDENLHLTYVLGWCIEILQTFQLVLNDITDNALIRRRNMCWYRHNNIGLKAVNDITLLEHSMYQLLNKHFKDKPYYTYIVELFHDATVKSSMGQCLDMLIANSFKLKKFENFTMENYAAIAEYKTAYNSFVLPVCLAMRMANKGEISQQVKTILFEIGLLLQAQDDFSECFGNLSVMGKIGTDIVNGKCSWFTVVALQKANSEQKLLMEENFNIDDVANVKVIKDLFEQLKLPNTFRLYEGKSYNIIHNHIQQLPEDSTQDLLFKFLKKLPKRTL